MKILIGVCGIGNGHLGRQTNVIELLLKNHHEIVIATTKNNISYFKNKFPKFKTVEIIIPWISCNSTGIDFVTSLKKYEKENMDYFSKFLNFSIQLEKSFTGIPDLVITDYEPNVAQYSYALNIPLICMEQQSKFLYLNEIEISKYSILEEKRRINYFFPKYEYKVLSSFFPIVIKDKRVKVVSPIIFPLDKLKNKKNHILVYFSPYENSYKYKKILKALENISNFKVIVYTKEKFSVKSNNIVFKSYSSDFKDDLENSFFLISTAGHQLLGESISLEIPVYLIPLSTYEQNYNAKMIEKYELGEIGNSMTNKEITSFIKNIPYYNKKIIQFKKKYYKNSWEKKFMQIINKLEIKVKGEFKLFIKK